MNRILFALLVLLSTFVHAESFLQKESTKALKEKKLILLNITSERCPYCLKMKNDVFENKKYRARIDKKFVYVEMAFNDENLPSELKARYLPTSYILVPKTLAVTDEFVGYLKPDHFLELLEEVYRQEMKSASIGAPSKKQ